jgi:hypothetical protein
MNTLKLLDCIFQLHGYDSKLSEYQQCLDVVVYESLSGIADWNFDPPLQLLTKLGFTVPDIEHRDFRGNVNLAFDRDDIQIRVHGYSNKLEIRETTAVRNHMQRIFKELAIHPGLNQEKNGLTEASFNKCYLDEFMAAVSSICEVKKSTRLEYNWLLSFDDPITTLTLSTTNCLKISY